MRSNNGFISLLPGRDDPNRQETQPLSKKRLPVTAQRFWLGPTRENPSKPTPGSGSFGAVYFSKKFRVDIAYTGDFSCLRFNRMSFFL